MGVGIGSLLVENRHRQRNKFLRYNNFCSCGTSIVVLAVGNRHRQRNKFGRYDNSRPYVSRVEDGYYRTFNIFQRNNFHFKTL